MMELTLSRRDYIQTGITDRRCMKLMPRGKGEHTNKVAVADSSGIMQLFSVKKGEVQHVFKTLGGPAVKCLELGGPAGQPRDRIFAASNSGVMGYSKKGKQFLDFKADIAESIRSMYIEETDLFLAGEYVYHHYRDCKDLNYLLCSDKINSLLCLPTDKIKEVTPILGCADRQIRMLQGSDIIFQMPVSGPVESLCLFNNNGGDEGEEVLYGTTDGAIGLIQISRVTPQTRWTIPNDRRSGGVLCMDNFDILADGVPDLIVGRDDGLIEVYGYNDSDQPVLRFSHSCSESITSVQGGIVGAKDYEEIVCSTYSGWLFGLTTETSSLSISSVDAPPTSVSERTTSNQQKILALTQDVDALQRRIELERVRYQESSQDSKAISAVPKFSVNDKFVLIREDASYVLSLEVQMSIDNVLLQSDVPIDLLDVEKNSAVVSFSNCNPADGNFLLATYRCQANTTRLELRIRTIEGQAGTIQAYVTPKLHPKSCQVRRFQVKPLSLHQRTNGFDTNRPMNKLQLTGNFSLAECHCWLAACLPELPDRCPAEDTATFYFISSFLDTVLECTYRRNEAVFRSDNISTISILKDALSREATQKSIRLDISNDVNEDSIPHVLRLIHPKLEHQLNLARKVQLIDSLKELQIHETNVDFLTPEYQNILNDADRLLEEYKRQPCYLERLYGMITDIYIDSHKFRGQNVKNKVPRLMSVLENYTLQALIDFFAASN